MFSVDPLQKTWESSILIEKNVLYFLKVTLIKLYKNFKCYNIILSIVKWYTKTTWSSPSQKVGMGDRRATMLPIVKTVYIFALKNCAWFGLHFSIFSLGHVKNPNEIKNRQIHLLYIIINNNKSPNMRSSLSVIDMQFLL